MEWEAQALGVVGPDGTAIDVSALEGYEWVDADGRVIDPSALALMGHPGMPRHGGCPLDSPRVPAWYARGDPRYARGDDGCQWGASAWAWGQPVVRAGGAAHGGEEGCDDPVLARVGPGGCQWRTWQGSS